MAQKLHLFSFMNFYKNLDEETEYILLALCQHKPHKRAKLAELLLYVSPRKLVATKRWNPSHKDFVLAQKQQRVLKLLGIQMLPVWMFPKSLLRAHPLPPVLFVRGNVNAIFSRSIGIVGSRKAAASTRKWAHTRAKEAAHNSIAVISGGACGIDSAAHKGALAGGFATIAFIGMPADKIYPTCNAHLFRTIISNNGALVSEHPPFACTYKGAHSMRNRLIAAQSELLLIAEAGELSGTLVTARYARQTNTPVFVAPSFPTTKQQGIQALLQEGHAQKWSSRKYRSFLSKTRLQTDRQPESGPV